MRVAVIAKYVFSQNNDGSYLNTFFLPDLSYILFCRWPQNISIYDLLAEETSHHFWDIEFTLTRMALWDAFNPGGFFTLC
jgi:hypothetical protein